MDSATKEQLLTPFDRDKRSQMDIAELLSTTGLVLVAYGLIVLLFACLPLRLVDPEWQLRASGAFSTSGPFLLIGLLLLCLARSSTGASKQLISRVKLLRSLSTWAAILYLLLVPVQLHAGVRLLRQKSGQEAQLQAQWNTFKTQLQATTSEQELRSLLATLPQPVRLPDKLDIPLPVLKEQLLTNVDSRFNALRYQSAEASSQRWQNFLGEATSNCLKTLLVAIGFAAFAQRRPGDPTLLNQGLAVIGGGGRRRSGSGSEAKRAGSVK
ncbi:HpsJ family protein [Synechococcus sp. CCY 9618]|uniref:HpsJ family protein n=1 Tax=Synechococcus sp. CCY 9618 TaxID=2815602 RepID=UPI001C210EF6|nr:HpsJ family protein [Synechococcus sp. CCY 9618]